MYLGTIDRKDLDRYSLRPDRRTRCDDDGIEWVKDLYKTGAQGGLPNHAANNLRKVV